MLKYFKYLAYCNFNEIYSIQWKRAFTGFSHFFTWEEKSRTSYKEMTARVMWYLCQIVFEFTDKIGSAVVAKWSKQLKVI